MHDRLASQSFFAVDARTLARRLLGQRFVRGLGDQILAGVIVETEAYVGIRDRASHAFEGRRTPRNESMYATPGTIYVYFTYGMHHCVNVVCGKEGDPQAVLIRSVEPTDGLAVMRSLRARVTEDVDLCRGPGNLCKAMGISREDNGTLCKGVEVLTPKLQEEGSRWIGIARTRLRSLPWSAIVATPRIGLGISGPWAEAPLRLFVRDSPAVSGRRS